MQILRAYVYTTSSTKVLPYSVRSIRELQNSSVEFVDNYVDELVSMIIEEMERETPTDAKHHTTYELRFMGAAIVEFNSQVPRSIVRATIESIVRALMQL